MLFWARTKRGTSVPHISSAHNSSTHKVGLWAAALAAIALMGAPVQQAHATTHKTTTQKAPGKAVKKKTSQTQKRSRKRVAHAPARPTDPQKDAALIIDGRTGATLYARNEDAKRYPASLTKMMTLYMVFDALKAGKVTMDTPLKVSAHATMQKPTKLYLKKGETIPLETAIKAIVVLSANDVASTIAENLGGSEPAFAQMMTERAHQLGMKNTQYFNASGLPDARQVTTAEDLAILARHVAYDYPQYFHYFSTVGFTWKGTPHITHNNLIGKYEGADGIKTGYTGASGFNLVSSVVRGGEHVIGVVMGGFTARTRDREMIRLLDQTFARAQSNPTLLARAQVPWQQIAQNSKAAPIAAGFDVTPSGTVARDNVTEVSRRWALFSNGRTAKAGEDAPVPTAKPAVQVANNYPQTLVSARNAKDDVGEGDMPDDARRSAAAMGARSWAIQIGAFASDSIARSELSAYSRRAHDLLNTSPQKVIPVQSANGHTIFRARFGPMAERDAREICAQLAERGQSCFATLAAR